MVSYRFKKMIVVVFPYNIVVPNDGRRERDLSCFFTENYWSWALSRFLNLKMKRMNH